MGAVLLVGLVGTWWVLVDARGLGVEAWFFALLLATTTSAPVALSARRRRPITVHAAAAAGEPLVIDLRDDVDRLRIATAALVTPRTAGVGAPKKSADG